MQEILFPSRPIPQIPVLVDDRGLYLPPCARGWYDTRGIWHAGIPANQ